MSKYNQLRAQLVALISEEKQTEKLCEKYKLNAKISEKKKEVLTYLKYQK